MTRQTNRQAERERKPEGQKRDAASTQLRYAGQRDAKYPSFTDREEKAITLNRHYMNDLYERSSI